jgi:hypothetical protein
MAAEPRSAILGSGYIEPERGVVKRMFAALISPCTTPRLCRKAKPLEMYLKMCQRNISEQGPSKVYV